MKVRMNTTEKTETPSFSSIVKKAFGYILIVVGILVGLWVVFVISGLLNGGSDIWLIDLFANGMDRKVEMPSGSFELPVGLYVALGYLLVCCLLYACVNISRSFIQYGSHLIQSDFKNLVTKLTHEMKAVLKEKVTGDS
jgi:uncharacterized integral membrane protein